MLSCPEQGLEDLLKDRDQTGAHTTWTSDGQLGWNWYLLPCCSLNGSLDQVMVWAGSKRNQVLLWLRDVIWPLHLPGPKCSQVSGMTMYPIISAVPRDTNVLWFCCGHRTHSRVHICKTVLLRDDWSTHTWDGCDLSVEAISLSMLGVRELGAWGPQRAWCAQSLALGLSDFSPFDPVSLYSFL